MNNIFRTFLAVGLLTVCYMTIYLTEMNLNFQKTGDTTDAL